MSVDHTFRLRLHIAGHLPNLHPSTIAWVRKARAGSLSSVGWRRQLHAELDAILSEVAAERKRAREAVVPMKRSKRKYD